MAIQTVEIDPDATALTGDEIIALINAGTSAFNRFSCINQDALKIVRTAPLSGEFYVKNMHRGSDGKIQVEYDDVAEP